MRASRRSLLVAFALGLGAGCASPEPEKEPPAPPAEAAPARRSRADEPIRVAQVGQYIIYPVQWLRAEEVAETLYPILQSRYGSAVRIVPHVPTNQLIIYIPTTRETEESLRGGGVVQPGAPGAGTPSRLPAPGSTRSPTGIPSPTETRAPTGTRSRTSTRRS